MINKISLIAVLTLVIITSGCTITGPGIKLKPASVEIGQGGSTHCPPGQAKKGRC